MRGCVAVLVFLAAAVHGLFEDQAGKVDWYRQQIGKVAHAHFHAAGQQRLALVATEPGVVAGLDLRSGGVAWRSVLAADEEVALLQPHGKALLSVSTGEGGAIVRLFGMLGGLTWDAHVPRAASPQTPPPPDAIIAGGMVVVCWQATVRAFHAGTGELLWEWAADKGTNLVTLLTPPTAEPSSKAASTTTGGTPPPPVHVFGLSAEGELSLTVLEPKDGGRAVTAATQALKASGASASASMLATLDRRNLVVLDGSGTKLLVHEVGSGGSWSGSGLKVVAVPSLAAGVTCTLHKMALPGALALSTSDGGSLLLKLDSSKAVSVAKAVEASSTGGHVFAHTTSREGKAVLALASLDASAPVATAMRFEVVQIDAAGGFGEWSAVERLPYDAAELGSPTGAWLNSYTRKDGSFGHRLLVSSADHSVQLLQVGKEGGGEKSARSWLRPEALAGVVHSELLPLPAAASEEEEGHTPLFAFALPQLAETLSRRYADMVGGPSGAAEATGPPPAHADAYGFRQAVIATTSAGKLFGLHSTDGSVLWSKRVPPPDDATDGPAGLPYLFVCPGGGFPHAIVVAQGSERWALSELNPFTGKALGSGGISGAGRIVHAVRLDPLAPADGSARAPVMLVDDQMRVHLFPKTPATVSAFKEMLGDFFFYLHRPAEGSLTGHAIMGDGETFKAVPRWSMSLPASGEGGARPTVSLTTFPHAAAVHAPVRVLGDRNVLHKYINRNLLAVGIEHPGDGEFEEASVQILLVDTVSGRVVHSVTHPGMRGPLTLLLGEHWLVCHFWSPKSLTYQMTVAELFTNTTISDDPLGLVLGGAPNYAAREHGFDGFVAPPPHVLSQGYAFGAPLAAMGVTQTVAGITPKFVLAGTVAGQLVLLDKRFLDPRRPIVPGGPQKMKAEDREEGLVPYGPSLGGISPLSVASHKHTVMRPRKILTAPTSLESTSLTIMLGLDLFMTRVAPAREFDRLNEDFNYVALVAAIVFLTVATLGSGWYSNQKDLARAWK